MHGRVALGLRALWALVLVAAAAGCQAQPQRTGSLLDWFTSAITDPNAQGEGPISGSMEVTLDSKHIGTEEVSGSFRYVGTDCAYSTRHSLKAVAAEEDVVSLGEWTYVREQRGPWVRSARERNCPMADIEAAGGLVDMGLENHFGRNLHRLGVRDSLVMLHDVDVLAGPAGITLSGMLTFYFWAEEDGTPAGMSAEGSRTEEVEAGTVERSIAMDWAFETHSGVVIDIPEGVSEPPTEAYARAAELHSKLASVKTAFGMVSGTYKQGDTTRPLNGSVRIVGGNTEIHIVAGQEQMTIWAEIVAGGNRYVSRDGTIWVARGKKETPTLLEVLAEAATDRDAGVRSVGGQKLHSIVSPADSLDVASAFGIDMVNVKGPGTRFRIWVDSSGNPAGFGGTLQWGKIIDGSPTAFELDIDVVFGPLAEIPIAAPKNPWKWIVDEKAGVAFGLPAGFSSKDVLDLGGGNSGTRYATAKRAFQFVYANFGRLSGDVTAKQAMDEAAGDFGYTIESRYEAAVDGQSGESALGHQGKTFMIFTLAVTDSSAYLLVFAGSDAQLSKRREAEVLSDQILNTVELMR